MLLVMQAYNIERNGCAGALQIRVNVGDATNHHDHCRKLINSTRNWKPSCKAQYYRLVCNAAAGSIAHDQRQKPTRPLCM